MEFVVGILLLLTFFGLAFYCIKGHNLMIGFLIITILWTALSFLGAAFASPEFLSTTAFYSNGEPVKAIAILNKIYQSAPEGWGTTLVNVCWGAWFGRVLMETGIASTLIRKTVELGGDKPMVTIALLNIVTAIIFTAMTGAGPVIAIGVIVLPIMMSLGVPKAIACWDYHARPGLYALTSAPWYTSIVMYGILTAIAAAVLLAAMCMVKKKLK